MDVMLKRFTVEGFRSFHNKVTLDLSHPHDYGWHDGTDDDASYITRGIISNALVLGVNATGKTNLGYALMDIRDNFRRVTPIVSGDNPDASYINGDCAKGYAEFSYLFQVHHDEVEYTYRKDPRRFVTYERLVVAEKTVFEYEQGHGWIQRGGLGIVGADGLNWNFADEELSIVGYLSNVLPKTRGQTIYSLRRFASAMNMVSAPMHSSRASAVSGQLRRLVRSPELVRIFEGFLRAYGVDERLEVVTAPDGEPVLYFCHRRRVPFTQACSSGTLTLLQLFSQFLMDANEEPSLVFVDEFDAYLHYEAAEDLVRWFGRLATCQTICTTHNTSLVRNATMRPDCVFEITREVYSDGGLSGLLIRPLADRTDREIRRVNNVEHLLRSGEFS